jgi:antitoxin component HigA of HigAB toxin-antitoxin module
MNLNVITTKDEYEIVLKELSELVDQDPALGSQEAQRFESLLELVEAYEALWFS